MSNDWTFEARSDGSWIVSYKDRAIIHYGHNVLYLCMPVHPSYGGYGFKHGSDWTGCWYCYDLVLPEDKKPCDEKTKAEIKAKIDELQRLYEKL